MVRVASAMFYTIFRVNNAPNDILFIFIRKIVKPKEFQLHNIFQIKNIEQMWSTTE